MKVCSGCGSTKAEEQFYKHASMADGYMSKCKECAKNDVRVNRERRSEHYQAYDAERSMSPQRMALREKYRRTPKGRAAARRAADKYQSENPERYKANYSANNAVKAGKLFPLPCEECGETKVHAHHDDYARPLNVRWLCAEHHKQWHSDNGEGVNA